MVSVMIELWKINCGHTGEGVTNSAWTEHWGTTELSCKR